MAALVAILQLFVVAPINQRFDAQGQPIDDLAAHMNRRFDVQDQRSDAQGQRLDRLADEVDELRRLTVRIGERLSRSEGQVGIIREQIETVDAP